MTKQADQGVFFGFLCLIFLLPVPLGSNRPWFWLFAAVAAFMMLAWVCFQIGRGRWRWSGQLRAINWPLRLLFLWLFVGLIQILPFPQVLVGNSGSEIAAGWHSLSVDWHASVVRWMQSLFFVALFVLALQLLHFRSRIKLLISVMIVAGVIQALWGSLMTLSGAELGLFGPKEYGRGLATGTFVNRNHYAGFLVLCLCLGIGRLIALMSRRTGSRSLRQLIRDWLAVLMGPKMRIRLALVVMVIALVLSRSRMGNTAFFASLLIAGVAGLVLIKKPPRSLFVLLVSLVVIDLVIVGTWFGVEQVVTRIQETGQSIADEGRVQDQLRLDVDAETFAAWKEYPLIGSGGGTFYTVFPAYRRVVVGSYFDHAHNDYLEIMLEYGILGIGIIGAWLILGLLAAIKAIKVNRDRLMIGLGFSALMAIIAVLMHSTVDFNLHIPSNAAYFVVILAMAHIAAGRKVRKT